jgi:hypothetical protein
VGDDGRAPVYTGAISHMPTDDALEDTRLREYAHELVAGGSVLMSSVCAAGPTRYPTAR